MRGARGDGGGAGGTNHRGGVEAGAGAGSGSQNSAQGGFSEDGFGGALAGGNDDDGGVDCRASGDGHAVISTISCIAGGSWAGNRQSQELTPLHNFK